MLAMIILTQVSQQAVYSCQQDLNPRLDDGDQQILSLACKGQQYVVCNSPIGYIWI